MSFPKIVNQMGSLGEKRKKLFFRFCRPILDIFGFPLLRHPMGSMLSIHLRNYMKINQTLDAVQYPQGIKVVPQS